MTATAKTPVVFLWHMHQPDYRDALTGEYYFPWTYLHAIKDYVDMVAHLEAHPGCKAVFNFVPILIEQLQDYQQQLTQYHQHQQPLTDPVLALLTDAPLPDEQSEEFQQLLEKCTRANRQRIIERFTPYRELVDLFRQWQHSEQPIGYFNQQFLVDMAVWHHLGWMGETIRRQEPRIQALQTKARQFTSRDRHDLLAVITETLTSLLQRYAKLAQKGQIELCTSPYAHPIVPLLLDFTSTREAMPEAPLPKADHYPGGDQRVHWHLKRGLEVFQQAFDFTPSGCWASEGSLSEATLKLLHETGFRWSATGDSVLFNSLQAPVNQDLQQSIAQLPDSRHTAYQLTSLPITVFFRDDGLSDKIGFEYADWHADDAAGDFIHHLDTIAKQNPQGIISIIMDGENAWEYYPENAWYFLDALYTRLEKHPRLATATYSDILDQSAPQHLHSLTAGSWVYGTFSTWIGDTDKNRAWDILCQAKHDYDQAIANGQLSAAARATAEQQLALCEGSDWFWWFGDYNPADSVHDFDYLFRRHVDNLYRILQVPAPATLQQPISEGRGHPAMGGVMRHGHQGS